MNNSQFVTVLVLSFILLTAPSARAGIVSSRTVSNKTVQEDTKKNDQLSSEDQFVTSLHPRMVQNAGNLLFTLIPLMGLVLFLLVGKEFFERAGSSLIYD